MYAFIGCLAFPLNVLGESVSFDTDNVAFMSPSQRIKVTGIVKDEAGITLPGVNVVVKGTIIGTITDANGQFTLEAPSDGVLLFTYVGFGNLELPVNGKENLEIIMKEGRYSIGRSCGGRVWYSEKGQCSRIYIQHCS